MEENVHAEKSGCFESYASIKALKRVVTEKIGISSDISGQYLRENILVNQYENIKEEVEEYLEYLKTGICNIIDIFEPEVICFGGSFAYYEDTVLYNKLLEKINEKCATFNEEQRPKFVSAKFKNNAGIIGATIAN